MAVAALFSATAATVAHARTSLIGPQAATFMVGQNAISESYEVYTENGRVFVMYHIDGSRANFGLTATRTWDASDGGCHDLIANVPIGPPQGAADHVLRVTACSTVSANGVRVSMSHYVREILAPGTVSDHEDASPIVLPDTPFTADPVSTVTAPPAPTVSVAPTHRYSAAQPPPPTPAPIPVAPPPAVSSFTTLTDQSIYDGVIDIGEGYFLRHVDYWYVGDNTHRFGFDVFGPRGRIESGAYQGNDSTPWAGRINALRIDGRTLYFAFSSWGDQRAEFHYAWR